MVLAFEQRLFDGGQIRFGTYNSNFTSTNGRLSSQFGLHVVPWAPRRWLMVAPWAEVAPSADLDAALRPTGSNSPTPPTSTPAIRSSPRPSCAT